MRGDASKSKWPEVREMIKSNWDRFEYEDIDSLKGHLHLLSTKIQTIYDYSKERSDREMMDFKRRLNSKKDNYV